MVGLVCSFKFVLISMCGGYFTGLNSSSFLVLVYFNYDILSHDFLIVSIHMATNTRFKGKKGATSWFEVVCAMNPHLTLGRDVNLDWVEILSKRVMVGKMAFVLILKVELQY